MESLPNELYDAIFDHLHLIDLARLKCVCKKFRSLVQDYRIRELVFCTGVYAINTLTDPDNGQYQNSRIIRPRNLKRTIPYQIEIYSPENLNSLFQPQRLNCLFDPRVRKFSSFTIFLRSFQFNARFLKSLTFTYSDKSNYLDFEEVNKLVLLERLEISFGSSFCSKPLTSHGKLALPNLKTLLLDSQTNFDFTIEVDVPRCEGLHLRFSGYIYEPNTLLLRVIFGNPHTVKYLSLHEYHESLNMFENIEFLQIVKGTLLIGDRLFAAFPRLKTLKIIEHNWLDGLKQLFGLSRTGGRNVQVVFHGVRLEDGKELDAFEESSSTFLRSEACTRYYRVVDRLIDNYDKLEDDLNFVRGIQFSFEIARLLEADGSRFLRKFNNLKNVRSEIQIERPDLFLRFLTGCSSLMLLWIINSGMSQEYFDQLGNIRTLYKLVIEEQTKVDLSFISKFPFLGSLEANQDPDLRKEIKLDEMKDWKGGHIFLFLKIGEYYVSIVKSGRISEYEGRNYRYTFSKTKEIGDWESKRVERFLSFEDLVRRWEEIRNEENKRMKV